ncbi:MAG: metallophosphoesterase [Thaumarchaeota archaeon]|nr:metallophosphoesterase [Candidatus Calditenuaceae archaeon]MDW8186988.1 metallophosphoesterase [Nitrososphaerota archaeon]
MRSDPESRSDLPTGGKFRPTPEKVVKSFARSGYGLTASALKRVIELCSSESELEGLVEKVSSRVPKGTVLDWQQIAELSGPRPPEELQRTVQREAKPEDELRLITSTYEDLRIEGTYDEFHTYRVARYSKLRSLLETRGLTLRSTKELLENRQEGYAACVVNEVSHSDGRYVLRLEDPSGAWTAFVSGRDRRLMEKVESLTRDMVVAVRVLGRGGKLVVRDIVFPEVSHTRTQVKGPNVRLCVISDVHIGSTNFNREAFEEFLEWLSNEWEDLNLRYLVINGDLVDGVFVYPNQREELELRSLKEQFAEAGRLLSKVPREVKVIYLPGNHEPVRRALPQTPIPREYRTILDPEGRITYCGNPALMDLGGVRLLFFHGQTMDDLIQLSSRFSYSDLREKAGEVMETILRCRHLSPAIEVTPILPTSHDHLLIEEVPDVLAMGHIHVAVLRSYRGVKLVNSGTWQNQTKLQKSVGLEPTVGTAVLIDGRELSIEIAKFS